VRTDGISRLLVINHREFHELMDEFPPIREAVLQALADRVRKAEADDA
jgi:CRP-like cAMP-binding protein